MDTDGPYGPYTVAVGPSKRLRHEHTAVDVDSLLAKLVEVARDLLFEVNASPAVFKPAADWFTGYRTAPTLEQRHVAAAMDCLDVGTNVIGFENDHLQQLWRARTWIWQKFTYLDEHGIRHVYFRRWDEQAARRVGLLLVWILCGDFDGADLGLEGWPKPKPPAPAWIVPVPADQIEAEQSIRLWLKLARKSLKWLRRTDRGGTASQPNVDVQQRTRTAAAKVDGPQPPNLLVWSGRRHDLPPRQWRLLDFMWEKGEASLDEVEAQVWDSDEIKASTVKATVSKLNNALLTADCPLRLSVKSGRLLAEWPVAD